MRALTISLLLAGCAGEPTVTSPDASGASPEASPEFEPMPAACSDGVDDGCRVESFESGGVERTYLVTGDLDAECRRARPLVLVWHGSGTNGEYLRRRFSLGTIDGAPVVIVYPNGLPRPELDGRTGWNRDPDGDDVRLFDEIVPHLAERHCVDAERVFSVGHSRGGRFVDVLGCYRSAAHRALASSSAGTNNVDDCPGQAPMWIAHGKKDGYVSFLEGQDWVLRWASNNGCDLGSFDRYPDDECTELPGCDVPVVWCPHTSTHEVGHGLPPFAAAEIEAFFARFVR